MVETVTIASERDRFEFRVDGKVAQFGSKKVAIDAFSETLTKLRSEFAATCPKLPARPDLTITTAGKTIQVYAQIGIVSDGKSCSFVEGDGLYYLPVHRDFLIGPETMSIPEESPFSLTEGPRSLLSIKLVDQKWVGDPPDQPVDWDVTERFVGSLSNFKVRFRVQTGIARGKRRLTLKSGNKTYLIYKVNNSTWGIGKPGQEFLTVGEGWVAWYDFAADMFRDPLAPNIALANDVSKPREARLVALTKIETNWSPNLRNLYHQLALRVREDAEIQAIALDRLKHKPSVETSGVMVQILEQDDAQSEAKVLAAAILRRQDPRAPKYVVGASAAEQAKALEFWKRWLRTNHAP